MSGKTDVGTTGEEVEVSEPDGGPKPSQGLAYKGSHLRDPSPRKTHQGIIGEWVGILLAALLAAILIKTFVMQSFYIPSGSMQETLQINDRVLVNKLAYRFGDVHRGDVIVFRRPPGETDKSINDLIKRVIAVPGDMIEARNGVVFLNGKALPEPYLQPGTPTNNLPLQTIRPGQLFVMGDNRTDSTDSRVFGSIDEDLVVGEASLRIWPIGDFGSLDN